MFNIKVTVTLHNCCVSALLQLHGCLVYDYCPRKFYRESEVCLRIPMKYSVLACHFLLLLSLAEAAKRRPAKEEDYRDYYEEDETESDENDYDSRAENEIKRKKHNRIFNGTSAYPGKFPYVAALVVTNVSEHAKVGEVLCGGSIITSIWILTAAHCTENTVLGTYEVVAGEYNIRRIDGTEQRRQVREYYVHEDYCSWKRGNDLSLIKLTSPLEFNRFVRPIPISTSGPREATLCFILGWGVVRNTHDNHGDFPDILQFTDVRVMDMLDCKNAWGEVDRHIRVTSKHVCTETATDSKSHCQGDSGGPLICDGALAGVITYGTSICGSPIAPAVYVRVSSFKNWLTSFTV